MWYSKPTIFKDENIYWKLFALVKAQICTLSFIKTL